MNSILNFEKLHNKISKKRILVVQFNEWSYPDVYLLFSLFLISYGFYARAWIYVISGHFALSVVVTVLPNQ